MTEQDGFRIEAAYQFGFEDSHPGADDEVYVCTEEALLTFAKACERAGMARAMALVQQQIDALDLETGPVLEAVRQRSICA